MIGPVVVAAAAAAAAAVVVVAVGKRVISGRLYDLNCYRKRLCSTSWSS